MRIGWATGLSAAVATTTWLAVAPASAQQLGEAPVDLHGASISVVRAPNAAACPGQTAILDRVRRHLAEGGGEPEGPLVIRATIDAEAEDFVARIVVSGHREGQRTLRAEGPGCEELADALAVSLALILDGTMAESLEPIAAPVSAPTTEPEPEPEPEPELPPSPTSPPTAVGPLPAPPTEPRSVVTGWFATGAAATYGVPHGLSGAVTLRLGAEYGRLSLAVGAFLAPTQTFPHGPSPGEVDVRLLGGIVHGCGRVVGQSDGLRFDACAAAGYGELHGEALNYEQPGDASRPWRALGAAAMARGTLVGPLGWGGGATLLAPVVYERFAVAGVEHYAFTTPPIAVFGGLELWVRFL